MEEVVKVDSTLLQERGIEGIVWEYRVERERNSELKQERTKEGRKWRGEGRRRIV